MDCKIGDFRSNGTDRRFVVPGLSSIRSRS
jgi:hypothetical protein